MRGKRPEVWVLEQCSRIRTRRSLQGDLVVGEGGTWREGRTRGKVPQAGGRDHVCQMRITVQEEGC